MFIVIGAIQAHTHRFQTLPQSKESTRSVSITTDCTQEKNKASGDVMISTGESADGKSGSVTLITGSSESDLMLASGQSFMDAGKINVLSGSSVVNGIGGQVDVLAGSSDSNIGGSLKLSGGVSNLGQGGSISAEDGESSFGFGGDTKVAAGDGEMAGGLLMLHSGSSTNSGGSISVRAGDVRGNRYSEAGGGDVNVKV